MKPLKLEKLSIHARALSKAAFLVNAASNPLRQRLLCLLLKKEELTFATICRKLPCKHNRCFHHLSVLCKAGLVEKGQEEGRSFFSVNSEKLFHLYASIEAYHEQD